MLRKLYDWVMGLAAGPYAPYALAAVAFCEGIFFPIPPDVMLAPIVLANRDKAWRYASLCLVCSVCGGCVGYGVGHFLTPVGRAILAFFGETRGMDELKVKLDQGWGMLMIALPVPYKLTAIFSGMVQFSFPLFVGGSILVRGIRFFAEATLLRIYGEPIRYFVEKRLALVAGLGVAALVAMVLAVKLLH
jgi:membrane protein YqaA with SNARE-associated domain